MENGPLERWDDTLCLLSSGRKTVRPWYEACLRVSGTHEGVDLHPIII